MLFLDAAHFVYGAFLGSLWCFARVFIRSPSGRQRFNVLGALDAVSRQVHLFTNETYITAQSVCVLLSQLAAFYGPRNVPLTLPMNLQNTTFVTQCTPACCEEWLFLTTSSGSGAQSASKCRGILSLRERVRVRGNRAADCMDTA